MVDFEVVELPPSDHPEVGETAPDFTRPLVDAELWEDVSLSDITDDGRALLVFHGMDGAFPATYVWNELRDRAWDDKHDVRIVGVSISTPYEHKTFIEEREMEYRLFSDPANDVGKSYGIEHESDGMEGISEPRPAMFLLDRDRTVEYAWVATEWPDFPDYDEVEQALED
ncbi:AhpC/TSA family protein [Haladaptatus sp. W1]|uniref:redoxin domain-containing protein n=1 Tax=Haladaptatus sp. W1 TaxID=1897478 RepID=UPI000849B101|nr:redoxin domain-containing protein [Haladaptatus sp. W1]ODR82639.1 AhpC/TSA family protein [Haladaptatus sp. W1]